MLSEDGKPGAAGLVCGAAPGARSYKQVEAELIEAVRLSRRMPGNGGGPAYATDGPWHLLTKLARASAAALSDRDGAAEWEAMRLEIEQQHLRDARNETRTVPLTVREVDWMESRFAWLLLVPEADRKLVWVALVEHATAKGRVSWRRIRERLMENRQWQLLSTGTKGLGMRYSRAIGGLTQALNRGLAA